MKLLNACYKLEFFNNEQEDDVKMRKLFTRFKTCRYLIEFLPSLIFVNLCDRVMT